MTNNRDKITAAEFRGRIANEVEHQSRHIKILNSEMGDMRNSVATLKTDVAWLKKSFWVVAGASITAAIASLFNLLS